jgi:diguanylate cyclase (GGDEF)-like protein
MDLEAVDDKSHPSGGDGVCLLQRITPLARQINCLDLGRIGDICTSAIPNLLQAKFSSIYLLDDDGLVLHLLRHNHPFPINRIVSLSQRPLSPMIMAIRCKELLVVEDMETLDKPLIRRSGRPFAANYQTGTCVICPLACQDKVVGVWNLADRLGQPFGAGDLALIELFGQLLGASIGNIKLFEKMQRQATTDGLTGLANHRTFYEILDRELCRSRRYGGKIALIMVDVDNLKAINDKYGHGAGDRVIAEIGKRLQQCIRQMDTAARYGGDEFAVILPNTTLSEAIVVADRMVKAVSEVPVCWNSESIPLTVSVGVGQHDSVHTPEDVTSRSDQALYMAKQSGKNTVRVFVQSQPLRSNPIAE